MFHVIYRWIILGYFIGWLTASGVQFSDTGARWLIFLTNWGIVGFVFYLLVAALSVTTKFLTVHCCKKSQVADATYAQDYQFKKPRGCCGYKSNELSWYQMIHWASFSMFGEVALIVTILYWAVLYTPGFPIDGVNANTHLINGIVSVVDVFFFGVPVSFLHFIYPMFFGAAFASFSGIYWSANGTNPVTGGRYIYSLLDYSNNTTTASIVVVLVVIIAIPLVHIVFYAIHLARFWLVYAIFDSKKISCWGTKPLNAEEMEDHEDAAKEKEEAV